MTRRDWTRLELDTAARWRREDVKVEVVARRLGRSPGSVKQALARAGVVVCPETRARRRPGMLLRSVGLLAGLPAVEVAERLGVDRSAVSRAWKRLGLPTPSRRDRALLAWKTRRMFLGAA